MTVIILSLTNGDNVIGVLEGKPDVTITLLNPVKYNMVNGYSVFSRYNAFSNAKSITFNRDSVTTYLKATDMAAEYYEQMVLYVEKFLDPSIEGIIEEGIAKIKEALNMDEGSLNSPFASPTETGDVSVDDFFKATVKKPKDGKLN